MVVRQDSTKPKNSASENKARKPQPPLATTSKTKAEEKTIIPPTPLIQTNAAKIKTINNTKQKTQKTKTMPTTKLDPTQKNILQQLVGLEHSKLYHKNKSLEFTRHCTKQKQPNFTYPHTDVSYINDFSNENHEDYKKLKQTFQIGLCRILAKHHEEKSEEATTNVENHLQRAEMVYDNTPELDIIKSHYKQIAVEKFIAKKPNGKKRGAGGPNQTENSADDAKKQRQ